MSFRVVWRPIAEESLAAIWLTARDRFAIESAADYLNEDLSVRPTEKGESRVGSVRIVFHGTLGMLFEVIEGDNEVVVLDIWECRGE
ncbi:MAG: hypothetical protein MI757_19125 [Pirellulales bacterium]|nr:hypothetical protein [Pirellulales bacterium]